MGERVGIKLSHMSLPDNSDHECSKCGMKKTSSNNGCCHDEEVVIKGAQDALSAITYIQVHLDVADLPVPHFTVRGYGISVYAPDQVTSSQPHGPPGYFGPPLFIRNCVFLI
jgi:hypothetical protein